MFWALCVTISLNENNSILILYNFNIRKYLKLLACGSAVIVSHCLLILGANTLISPFLSPLPLLSIKQESPRKKILNFQFCLKSKMSVVWLVKTPCNFVISEKIEFYAPFYCICCTLVQYCISCPLLQIKYFLSLEIKYHL